MNLKVGNLHIKSVFNICTRQYSEYLNRSCTVLLLKSEKEINSYLNLSLIKYFRAKTSQKNFLKSFNTR